MKHHNTQCRILGVIPARGGSKRLPGKNIRPLGGRPLIQHIIETCSRSRLLTDCIVSTDSEAIRRAAMDAGAQAPFLRPDHLASDTANSQDVLRHALEFFAAQGNKYTHVVLMQPTSPLTRVETIDRCIERLLEDNRDMVFSADAVHVASRFMGTVDPQDTFLLRYPAADSTPEYVPTGNVYAMTARHAIEAPSLFSGNLAVVMVTREEAVDIDYEEDFVMAQIYFDKLNQNTQP
ncbi:acylneuraminate cytidylyltransferase family protein [Desulfovibrio psychrotolerans]|uniref:Acylneuraminate cytidylyltransferase n=1 Tax=Desulfovibrio psychrotolerans TaxID=415242 RepID=A0A7J0BWL8_9BACT|nr:acylneuraminate cytidylyltransferase family protein [Desulfovibrio psychrotolerans]GFM38110.1 hypothetical protein DSM19430T_27940 [Desulfovibrio psychrotolerans]